MFRHVGYIWAHAYKKHKTVELQYIKKLEHYTLTGMSLSQNEGSCNYTSFNDVKNTESNCEITVCSLTGTRYFT